jgi:hypothetical protein
MFIPRLAFLIGLFVVGAVFFMLYFALISVFTIFLFGLSGPGVYLAQYALCLVAGYWTAIYLMRNSWPKDSAPKQPPVQLDTTASSPTGEAQS